MLTRFFLSCVSLFVWLVPVAMAEPLQKKPVAVTTLFVLYDFTRELVDGRMDVAQLIPPGVEPHEYEPTPADIAAINGADVFVYMGDVMEPWVKKLLPGITNQNLLIVDASRGFPAERLGGTEDPHYWLDFSFDKIMAAAIADALSDVDGENRRIYKERAADFEARLTDLDQRYFSVLAQCATRTVYFGGHSVFGYLAARYGLNVVTPFHGFSPDAEPSARAVGEMINAMKAAGAKRVYYEELIDPRVARVLAEETGAKMELLHGAHNISPDDKASGKTFLSIMEDDLQKLREGLQCR